MVTIPLAELKRLVDGAWVDRSWYDEDDTGVVNLQKLIDWGQFYVIRGEGSRIPSSMDFREDFLDRTDF